MSTLEFPYQRKKIEEGEIPDPRLSLVVETVRGPLRVKFLLDSGADVTTLPLVKPYVELFEFQIKPREKVKIGGIEGRGIDAYPFLLKASLGGTKFDLRSYFVDSLIDPLLGRLDFWNLFSINFDNRRKRTVFQKL